MDRFLLTCGDECPILRLPWDERTNRVEYEIKDSSTQPLGFDGNLTRASHGRDPDRPRLAGRLR